MKSANCISTTGRIPSTAAPIPAPTISASEIGVSITRSSPNASSRPFGRFERAAQVADVLAHDEDVLVAAHLLVQRRLIALM